MAREDHFRKLENAYHTARINEYYSPRLTMAEGKATIEMTIDPKMHHAADALHGSVSFKLLDDAAFFAANSVVEDVFIRTASFTIDFLQPVAEGKLTAKGWLVGRSGRRLLADSSLEDENGNLIARGHGIFMESRIPLDENVGYE